MFAGRQPPEKKTVCITEQLEPLRRDLLAKRKEGFNYREIAAALTDSKLKCDVSPSLIKQLLTSPAAKKRAKLN